ncbi:MAG: T9SS type A sorting domain-containing protein [Muribaculaceae bacterium]|nr:T9SS type A sorting domain-containing protein [Muribaculaceae bacterium]
MKQKLLQFLFVIAAIITAIPIANAAASDYKINAPTKNWTTTFTIPDDNSRQLAISKDGVPYTLSETDKFSGYVATYRITSSGNHLVNLGWTSTGAANAFDDAGNYVTHSAGSSGPTQTATTSPASKYCVREAPNSTTATNGVFPNGSGVAMNGYTAGKVTLYLDATGDVRHGNGYIWFAQTGTSTNITCLVIKNVNGTPTVSGTKSFNTGIVSGGGNDNYLNFYDTSNESAMKCLLQVRGVGIYDVTLNATAGTVTSVNAITCTSNAEYNSLGAHIFMMRGRKLLCRNTRRLGDTGAARNKYSEFEILDITDSYTNPTKIATIDHLPGKYSNGSSLGNGHNTGSFIQTYKHSEDKVEIFAYVQGSGCSSYIITASAITNPVTSLSAAVVSGTTSDVKVSWAKPSAGNATKYSVSYSSDGGSTWSSAVETTNLNYTFNNLPTGSYIFKVTPYYGGSSTWGEATTSNSINVINAVGAPISNLAYTYLKNTETNVGRQDITLTWNAPTGMVNTTLTGYKVYREGSLLATLGADALTYTNTGVKQNYTYKVVPTFDGLTEDASFGLEVTTTEVQAGVLVAPVISETRNYEGYSLVEIFFKMPNYAPYKPLYFNLYRDGKLIQGKLQSYNTLDESLVRASVETTVNYQVEAVYGSAADVYPPIDSVKSDITTLVIAPRDWAKTGYILQEVYNVPINEIADDKKPALFDNNNYYRQGQFRDGKWYIAQRSDNLSKQDEDPTSGGGQIDSNVASATGGILVFNAENADQVKSGYEKIFTKSAFENVGIAMDDAGTLFVRNNNFDKLKATVPTGHGDESAWGWMKDAFERRITEGTFYKRNADGTYSEVATKLDLSKIWTDNRWIDRMYFTGLASNGQVIGRSDYYHMWGDVLSAEGGYLILSPSWTRTAFKVKIVNGQYVSHEVNEFNRYENTGYLLEPKTGTENYGFHLDGRDDVTVQIRSNGYYGVHEWSEAGTTGWHPIYTADSRINNAGGTSIQAFGEVDGTGRHTGELFIITPQSMHSHNVGDFLISRTTKENADDYADEGSLMPSTPVAQYIQTDARSNSTATNANGNWFHAEKGTYASAMKDDDECVDIYQYVPGTRFARYRLIPSNQFPPVQPTLDITTAYNDDKTDITHFDGVATWQRPAGFGRSTGSANAKVVSYLFEMHNNKNELVTSAELPELYKTDGTPVDDEYVYDFNYTDTTGNKDIDFGRYSVNVRVKYQTKDGLYHISDPLYAEDIHDYPAKPAENLYIEAFVAEDITIGGWTQKEDGSWVVETQKADRYRIDLDFSKPTDAEPVSYYTLKAVVNKTADYKGDTINIENFLLHNGAEIKDGKLWAKTTSTSQIPGTYDFENAKAPYYTTVDDNGDGLYNVTDGGSRQNVVLSYFYDVPVNNDGIATVANGDEVVINNTPDEWEFIIVAHYAARNTYIDKSKLVGITPNGLTPTGVEVVGDDNILAVQIYPIPAHSTITVKSPEAINSIVIYNEAGVEVMNLNGDGKTIATVNIEDLATGFYFVKVNNNAPVKIIKK